MPWGSPTWIYFILGSHDFLWDSISLKIECLGSPIQIKEESYVVLSKSFLIEHFLLSPQWKFPYQTPKVLFVVVVYMTVRNYNPSFFLSDSVLWLGVAAGRWLGSEWMSSRVSFYHQIFRIQCVKDGLPACSMNTPEAGISPVETVPVPLKIGIYLVFTQNKVNSRNI